MYFKSFLILTAKRISFEVLFVFSGCPENIITDQIGSIGLY
ncbi:hypothetical protein SBF1_560039 [Candidatus Desulfosporosinus infrequens]|uniref:Uncharacterized protein n=1 Tax=Candidatus Desulfosporosinus infrequens TaxID=2043169 RepID=A0A2U3LJH7_9FIRM|nr:hypothetical protein SBF1_560039 [Candidatus Desulfosporosinus infrequens]